MAVEEKTLLDAVEGGMHLIGHVPGLFENLGIPGLRGRVSNLEDPLTNLVGAARLEESEAPGLIAQVKDRYAGHGKQVGWMVSEWSTPSNLGEHLQAAGFQKSFELVGMVLTDLAHLIQPNPAVEVREVTIRELREATELMGQAYGLSTPVQRLFNEAAWALRAEIGFRAYLAYVKGDAAAWSYMMAFPGQPIVQLGGAATLEQHRGKGIYTSLVARRLADARAEGYQAAVIQAVRTTSAPICRNLGFRDVMGFDFYVYAPT